MIAGLVMIEPVPPKPGTASWSLCYNQYFHQHAETYVSTEQPAPREDARVSDPHEKRRRPRCPLAPTSCPAQKAHRQLREVTGYQVFPKVSGCCAHPISERSTTLGRAIPAPFSPRSTFPGRTPPERALALQRRVRLARLLSAIGFADACAKPSGSNWTL